MSMLACRRRSAQQRQADHDGQLETLQQQAAQSRTERDRAMEDRIRAEHQVLRSAGRLPRQMERLPSPSFVASHCEKPKRPATSF